MPFHRRLGKGSKELQKKAAEGIRDKVPSWKIFLDEACPGASEDAPERRRVVLDGRPGDVDLVQAPLEELARARVLPPLLGEQILRRCQRRRASVLRGASSGAIGTPRRG